MNKKIIILAILFVSVFAVSSLFAQGWGGRHINGRGYGSGTGFGMELRYISILRTELGLSDKQVKQVFDINTQYREKYFENRNNLDKLTDLRAEHQKAIETVLTKEQLDKYNKFQDNDNRYGWNRGCSGPGRW